MKETAKEALYYKTEQEKIVKCQLCPHMCSILENEVGKCSVRQNKAGKLRSLNYGKIASYGKDPIEKKPLYHFYPGESIFSIGSFGCNFKCDFCQNYAIAQEMPSVIDTTASNLADIALNEKNNIGVAYTYNEPTVWYEFMQDIATAVHKAKRQNVMVTNGFINPEPLDALLPLVDAMNIDLKSMNNAFYKTYCGGRLEPVQEAIKLAASKTHVELTTLLIEGLNTDEAEIESLAKWIASVDDTIPLHLSRYFPHYKMKHPATDVQLITRLSDIAKRYLKYVYIGNVWEVDRNTYCPECETLLVDRSYLIKVHLEQDGKCPNCGHQTNILMRKE